MNNNIKNIIVFGAGGGNDIFSAMAYINDLNDKNPGINYGLVGVLGFTPFHTNSDDCTIEPPIIKPTNNFKRYLVCKPPKEIRSTECMLPNVCASIVPFILDRYLVMSPKYNAQIVAEKLKVQLSKWRFDANNTLLDIVDFGGDILTNGERSEVISPGLDAFTLQVVYHLHQIGFQTTINICFPGVDGELHKDYLKYMCINHAHSKRQYDPLKYIKNFDKLLEFLGPVRPANTIPNMLGILRNSENLIVQKRWRIKNTCIVKEFQLVIDKDLCQYIWTFDFIEIYNHNPFAHLTMDSSDLLDRYHKIQKIYEKQSAENSQEDIFQGSDFHLQYLRQDSDGHFSNKELIDDKQTVLIVDQFPKVLTLDDINNFSKEIQLEKGILFDTMSSTMSSTMSL